jgi:hypothetical protein
MTLPTSNWTVQKEAQARVLKIQQTKNFFTCSTSTNSLYCIEEVKEGEDNNGSDSSVHNEVPDLAACTAQLSENQCEQWIEEMNAMGINF